MARYDLTATKVGQLLEDPAAVSVIERRYPGLTSKPMVTMLKGMVAQKAIKLASGYVSDAEVAEVVAELESL